MLLPDAPGTGEAIGTEPQEVADPPKIEPDLTPPPAPAPKPAPPKHVPSDDLVAQWAGADKALLTSSVAAGIATQPDQQTKIVRLADQLGVRAEVVAADYEHLSRQVALRGADLTRISLHHPELASWLMQPENASIAHDDLPVLKQLDVVHRLLAGKDVGDVTGILPEGYMFQKDGSIRGPLAFGQAVVYPNLEALQQHFARQADIEATRAGQYGDIGSFSSALYARTAGYIAALRSVGGPTDEAQGIRREAEAQLAEAEQRDPSLGGAALRLAGGLAPDLAAMALPGGALLSMGRMMAGASAAARAALRENEILRFQRGFNLGGLTRTGGQVVTSAESARNLRLALDAIAKGAETLPAAPRSTYLVDAFKNAVVFAPVAAAGAINKGVEQGPAYGVEDFLINAMGPAAAGRFGFAKAVLPGEETAAAAGGYLGVAGRLLANTTTQGGAMAVTELANAMHEVATGVDPTALDPDSLVPRMAQAGAMGAVMAGAFHLPGEIGGHIQRQHIAARAALDAADLHGAAVELLQASKANERVPARVRALAEASLGGEGRIVYLQDDGFLDLAKSLGMPPEELAAQMHVEAEWTAAKGTGKTMVLPTAEVHQYLAKLGDEGKEREVSQALLALRQRPDGMSGQEALDFYQAAPKELDAQIAAMRQDVAKAAKTVSEADPIYQDWLGKLIAVGRDPTVAKDEARIMAAFFNTKAARFNAEAAKGGGPLMDPLAQYQRYNLRVQTAEGVEPTALAQPALEVPSESLAFDALLKQWKKAHGDRSPTPGDKDWLELEAQAREVDRVRGIVYEQPPQKRGGARGSYDPERFLITLTGKADVSTVMHESGHAFLEFTLDFAEMANAPTSFKTDAAILLRWLRGTNAGPLGFDQAKPDRIGSSIQAVRDLLKGHSRSTQGSRLLRAESLLRVFPEMVSAINNPEILRTVIASLPVDVVDVFRARKLSPEDALHDPAMLQKSFTANGPEGISISVDMANALDALLGVIAHARAKVSGMAHEGGRALEEPAALDTAKDRHLAEYESLINEWKGLSDEEKTARHEKFARGIEQFLMEGNAPSPELRPVFHRFLYWLTDLYKKVRQLVKLTPEVREVMDRMLASDEAIARAKEDTGVSQTFKDRASSGMTEAQWTSYLKLIQRDREQANSNVFGQAMRVLRRERTKVYKAEYAGAKEEAAAIVNARPISKAEDTLVHGIDDAGKDLPQKPKLARSQVEALRGEEFVKSLPRGVTGVGEGAHIWDLQRAAEEFGFSDSDSMLDALTNIPDRKATIRSLAEGMMQARHPDLTPEAMLEEALKAVHANSSQGDILGRESAALAIKAGRTAVPQAEIRRIAENEIANTPMEDINPKVYLRAQKQRGDECTAELLKKDPDYTRAHNLKQAQELAHACYRAAQEAAAVIEKTDDLMATIRRKKTQVMLGKAGAQGWSVVNPDGSVMPMADEASALAAAQANGGTAQVGLGYQAAMNRMRDFWDLPDHLELPYGAVLDFYRQAVATMHQAREAQSILVEARQEELTKTVSAGIRVEDTNRDGGQKPPIKGPPLSRGKGDEFKRGFGRMTATMRAASFVARQMDGERDGGWHWEHFIRPLNEASDNQQTRQYRNTTEMDAIYKAYGKTNFRDHRVFVPEVGERLSLETRLAVALNSGSTKNLRRLAEGRGLDRAKVQAIIDTLDEKDWEFVKAVWGVVNRDWEETKALNVKLFGIAPEKRDSLIVSTKFGNIQGQYYPIIYDMNRSARDITQEQQRRNRMTRPEPRHSFTHQTVEHVDRPLLLTLDGIHRHLNDTAHWLSHAETIENLNKLLNDERLSSNMIARFGEPAYNVLRDTVNYVAVGHQGPQVWWDKIVRWLRTRSGTATMGFNTMSALSQPFGMTQSMERVGSVRYLKAQTEFALHPQETSDRVRAMSTLMRHRGDALIVETAEQQGAGPVRSLHEWIQKRGAYWMMNRMQWTVDVPTWLAGFERAKERFPDDEAKCVAMADQDVIDTQGTGLAKDMSDVQRHELTRMLTQFGGFFLRTYNLLYNRAATDAHLKGGWLPSPNDGEALGRIASTMLLTVSLPAVAMSVFKQLMKPDKKAEPTAAWWAKHLLADQAGYLLNTVIFGRELTGAIQGFDWAGPAGMRSVALSSQLVKQLMQGKADHGLERAAVLTAGTFTGLPGTQAQRIIDAILYYHEHPTLDPRPLLAGPPR